jgi:ring-1,2-phenylacetyl-CoA epoxidase subunit PaaE
LWTFRNDQRNCRLFKKDKKVPAIQVLFEYFTAPDEENTEEMSDEFKAIANIESMVTVIIDDDEYSFHLNSKKRVS